MHANLFPDAEDSSLILIKKMVHHEKQSRIEQTSTLSSTSVYKRAWHLLRGSNDRVNENEDNENRGSFEDSGDALA
ncbi:hypothetical protein HN011_010749 [Eciton burchellii]|nr:hypothetical protein HN011_010749 [Eciton burchellii]